MASSAEPWSVPREYFEPLYRYLVNGFEPGSFWTAVLANDFMTAIQHSHPLNEVEALKRAANWIQNSWPRRSWGSWSMVGEWLDLSDDERRTFLEEKALIYTEREEVDLALRGIKCPEPYLI